MNWRNNFLGRLFAPHLEKHLESQKDVLGEACSEVQRALEASYKETQGKLNAQTSFAEIVKLQEQEQQRQAWALAEKQARAQMRSRILEHHRDLGTGLDEECLERLQRALKIHFASQDGSNFEARLEGFILQELFSQVGPFAWKELATRVTKPLEVPNLSKNYAEMNVHDTADLLLGVVAIWRHAYPEPGSWVWQNTEWLGVLCGLRARMLVRVLEIWFQRPAELEREMAAQLAVHLDQLQHSSLANPLLSDLARVTSELDDTCRRIIPQMVWRHLAAELARESNVQLQEPVQIDPVCWMRVPVAKARYRADWQGRSYLFCHEICMKKFNENPEVYL